MQMTLTLHTPRRRPRPEDVTVCWSGAHEAADLCRALAVHLRMPVPHLTSHGRPVPATTPVGAPPLVHGASLAVGIGGHGLEPFDDTSRGTALELVVVGGPDAGRSRPLVPPGVHVGRSDASGLTIADHALSRRHAFVAVGPGGIVIEDAASTNGVRVDGRQVVRPTAVDTSSTIVLGSSTLRVRRRASTGIPMEVPGDGTVIVRPTTADAPAQGPVEVPCPAPPPERARNQIPWVAALVPVPVGLGLAMVLGPQLLLFTLLGPVTLLANAVADRWGSGRSRRREVAAHAAALHAAETTLALALRREATRLELAHPDPHDVLRTAENRLPGLWRASGLHVRLGTGDVTTRVVRVEGGNRTRPVLEEGPVVLDLERVGLLGVVGPPELTSRVLANVVGQLCVRHPPGRLSVSVASRDPSWDWVGRMPHAARPGAPGKACASGAVGAAGDAGLGGRGGITVADPRVERPAAVPGVRRLLVVPDGASPLGSCALTEARTTGDAVVVAVGDPAALPVGCPAVVTDAGDGRHELDGDGERLTVTLDLVGDWWAERVSRALAPLRCDAQRPESDLPSDVHLPVVLGLERLGPADVLRRWEATDADGSPPGLRPPLAAVGVDRSGAHVVDLRRDGPHVLVGGTTGSGKSELLRTLVTSLALSCPPSDLTFVLVDFKGGAAFGACAGLPHVVGLVTDLDEHLVARALTSLGAEIRRRERLFAAAGVTDVEAYARCRASRSEPVPRLVVVIDELRALVDEVPDFVRGLVRLAALGRSLGLHLVLATQRPSGAVTAEIQANVNLRIALRMRDRSDSVDVIEDDAAARLTGSTPGRALARRGDGSLVAFQTATVAASPRAERRFLVVTSSAPLSTADRGRGPRHGAGLGVRPDPSTPSSPPSGGADGAELVHAVIEAHRRTGASAPRAPWLPALPDTVPALVGELSRAVVGVVDEPDLQTTSPLAWLDGQGTWLLSGRPRSGRTTAARAVVLGATAAHPADRLHVHVIDVSGSLTDLVGLPHVGTCVDAEDARTVADLTSYLRQEVRRRRARIAGEGSSESPAGGDPTILLVVDGWDQLLEAHPDAARLGGVAGDDLLRVLRDGPGVGVVAAVAGGRSLLQSRWSGLGCETFLLGAADPLDAALAGLRAADLATTPPAGRGVRLRDRRSVQFVKATPETTTAVAASSGRPPAHRSAPVLRALPSVVRRPRTGALRSREEQHDPPHGGVRTLVEPTSRDVLAIGVCGGSAATWCWDAEAVGRRLLVSGPGGSGRTNTLQVLAESAVEAGREVVVVRGTNEGYLGAAFPCQVLEPSDTRALVGLRRRYVDLVVVVDDAHLLDGTEALAPLREIAQLVDRDGGLVAVSSPTQALGARFRGLDVELARSRTALVLSPRATDGEPFGVGRLDGIPTLPGRAAFVHHGAVTEVQVYLAGDGSAGSVRTGEHPLVAHRQSRERGHDRHGDDHPPHERVLALDQPDADRHEQGVPDEGGSPRPHRPAHPSSAERPEAGGPHEDEQGRHHHARGVAALTGEELVEIEHGEPDEHDRLRPSEQGGEEAGAA